MKLKEKMFVRTKLNDFCNMVAIRKIDERVKKVMLKDLESTVDYYMMDDIDFAEFMKFAEWLKGLEVIGNIHEVEHE